MLNAPVKAAFREPVGGMDDCLSGGGEAGELIRSFDWTTSRLGPVAQWPQSLKTCMRILLASPQPMFLWWGEDAIHIHNDACRLLLDAHYPDPLGLPAVVAWSSLWDQLAPRFNSLMAGTSNIADTLLLQMVQREGLYYNFNACPVPDESGQVAGIMATGSVWHQPAPMAFVKTDISSFTNGLLSHFEQVIRQAKLTLVTNFHVVTKEVYVDRDMWEKILFTLLANALRYTLRGAIAVRLMQQNNTIQLSVSDTGMGLSPDLMTAVRENLLQKEADNKGLALVNELVMRHGGELQITSVPGEGSTFLVTIPIGKAHLPADKVISGHGTVVYKQYTDFFSSLISNIRVSRERRRQEAGVDAYRRVIACLPAAVYTCDKQGRILLYNEAAIALWGREPVVGVDMWNGAWKIYQPDGITAIAPEDCPMAQAIKTATPVYNRTIVIERPDGSRRIVAPHPVPLFDEDGELTGAVNMLVDITHEKTSHEHLSKLAAIVENSDDAIVSKTLDGIVTSWNPAAERLFGYSAAEMIGKSITNIIPPDKLDEEPKIIEILKSGQRVDHFQTKRITKEGEIRDFSLTISPIKDMHGNVIGASKIARDITQQRQLFSALQESEARYMQLNLKLEAEIELRTKELQDANYYLEKSNQELEQFAYVTSHDLQEPLRKIHTFAGMLHNVNKDILSDTSCMYLDKVMSSAKRMSQLINELLDYSRLVHVKEPFVATDLNEILKNVLIDFEVPVSLHDVQLETGELPRLLVSPLQMNQLFHNLLGNALKFLSPGRQPQIKVYAEPLSAAELARLPELDQGLAYWVIVVKDNGIGFDQMYASKIFQIFQRLNDRTEFEGTGIGLALCSKIVANHKGHIYANGAPGEGAEFRVILPAQQ
ncbi:MAG: PAS domain S-box protein [Chitinophaga sp.]|uniref:PAS domain S-box protein n=1 Tax=Chitinophaga sp. TaxID=1869181 RepID=UPI001B297404|nr:PAS domain S-box protein [Chitinophaga sp.]MBO9731543.1 PAS domain S-box protein [Chitinophaga sp.]